MKDFFAQLKSSNCRKTMTIYVSSALTTIGLKTQVDSEEQAQRSYVEPE